MFYLFIAVALISAVVTYAILRSMAVGFAPHRYAVAHLALHAYEQALKLAQRWESEFLWDLQDRLDPRHHAYIAHPLGFDTYDEIDECLARTGIEPGEWRETWNETFPDSLPEQSGPKQWGPKHRANLNDLEQRQAENNIEALEVLREKLTGLVRQPKHRDKSCWAVTPSAEDLDNWAAARVEGL